MYKKDRHSSYVIINDASHLHRILHIIFAPNISMYNITPLETNYKTKGYVWSIQTLPNAMDLEAFDYLQNVSVKGRALDCL